MTVETELKLRISPEHLARLKRHPMLRSLSTARATTRKLYSIYFDTPDLYLHEHAMALRLRRVGRQWVQTLKGGGAVQAGLHQRNEWESVVADEALDFSALEASGATHLPRHVRKELQAVFVTDFSRTARMLNFEGAQIELSLDSGEIRAGRQLRQLAEIELELKSGAPLQLFRLALKLLGIVPLEVEATSKAEYGYQLWVHVQPEIVRAEKLTIADDAAVAAALKNTIWSCLTHLQSNISGALEKRDDEYLHQIRVALRRLRVALSIAGRVLADAELNELRRDVAALSVALGRTREWDVFVSQTLMPVRRHFLDQPGVASVLRSSERARKLQHHSLQEALQSQAFQRLLLRFGAWMSGSYWQEECWRDLMLPRFATPTLQRLSKRVDRLYLQLAVDASPMQLHILRIACKKLRYSAELFAALYSDKKVRCYLAALAKTQDNLGSLNDIAIARRLLDEMGAGKQHEATVLIRGWVEHDYAKRMANLHKAWKRFFHCDPFWQ